MLYVYVRCNKTSLPYGPKVCLEFRASITSTLAAHTVRRRHLEDGTNLDVCSSLVRKLKRNSEMIYFTYRQQVH